MKKKKTGKSSKKKETEKARPAGSKTYGSKTSGSKPASSRSSGPRAPGSRPSGSRPSLKILQEAFTRLTKYIANAGVCSRREADNLILSGVIKVNGQVITELGTKVARTDRVQYGEETLSREKTQYVLLNKPKGYITTTDDPFARRTVIQLVSQACKERIYPVGRLDRNTTGVLLFTNDGAMAKKLTHPKHRVKKVYHVVLDKALTKNDMAKVVEGFEIDDGFIKVDRISYDQLANDKRELGIEIHSGRNRIVRRIFEALGYKVTKLDRTMFAGLTKKNIPRGRWRFLEEYEINTLKIMG